MPLHIALGQIEGILQPLIDAKPSAQKLSAGIQPILSFGPQLVLNQS